MGLLTDRTILVTGVLTSSSIAHACARVAQEEGHRRALLVRASDGHHPARRRQAARGGASRRARPHLRCRPRRAGGRLAEHVDHLDGVVHAVGFAPPACLGQDDGLLAASWDEVATALQVSTWSLPALARAVRSMLRPGAPIVGLDFDASVAWPAYDWMGVAKAGLESAARYLARDLGPGSVRVNLVAAGPLRTVAARSIRASRRSRRSGGRAPLGWDVDDAEPVARSVAALLSDWFPATTGEIVHVDGGAHAVGVGPGER
ncbi:MAG: SDR family oxidoreductase [Acidimicrobiales bacterium]